MSSTSFSDNFFCLHKYERKESFHLLAIQMFMKHLPFLHWILFFSFYCDRYWKKKTKQTSLHKPINPATELLLPNDCKPGLSIFGNLGIDYNEFIST